MADDFAPNITTTGRYTVHDDPLLVRADFSSDSDWFRISGLKRYTHYNLLLFPDKSRPLTSLAELAIFDHAGDLVHQFSSNNLPNQREYYQARPTANYYVEVHSYTNLPVSYVQFYAGELDEGGNSISDATELRLNEDFAFGGAINKRDDIDWFSFDFRAGQTYSINLLGASSFAGRETTLGDPILRVFDENGQFLKGDNNSGKGTDARLVFTATVDGTHYLRVSGDRDTRGSYLIKSNQLDDYLGSTETTHRISPMKSVFSGRTDFFRDVDVARVFLKKGFEYVFHSNISTEILDPRGEFYYVDRFGGTDYDRPPRSGEAFKVRESGDYFIVARGSTNRDFSIEFETFDRAGNTLADHGVVSASIIESSIDFPMDRDRFRISMMNHARYRFDVVGTGDFPLTDPGIVIRDSEGNFLENHGDGSFVYTTDLGTNFNKLFYLDVRSNDPTAVGLYQLKTRTIDRTPGDTSTTWTAGFRDGVASIRDALEFSGDVDYYRVNLKADTWYKFTQVYSTRPFDIVAPGGSTFTTPSYVNPTYYRPNVSGAYYVVSREASTHRSIGSFGVDITEGAKPVAISGALLWPNGNEKRLDSVTRFFSGYSVEFSSDLPMRYRKDGADVDVPANQLTLLTHLEWLLLKPYGGGRTGEVFARSVRPSGLTRSWSNIQVTQQPDASLLNGTFDYHFREFAFADGLPDYLSGDPTYDEFIALTESEQESMRAAAASWSSLSNGSRFREIDPGENNDAAPFMIFKAALDSGEDVLAFAPGDGIGGDIIINTNSPVMSDLTPGGQGYFELLRALGTALGLSEPNELKRDRTVMGSREPLLFETPFPSTPMPFDLEATKQPNMVRDYIASQRGNSTYSLVADRPFYRMIHDGDYRDYSDERNVITAEGLSLNVAIDLRPGMKSYVNDGAANPFTFVNSVFTVMHDGTGGEGNDRVTGNERNNVLRGNAGNDVLIGGPGQDLMLGGSGNDFYKFRPGYGDDVIDEEELGGRDILRIEGRHDTGFLHNDLTFERLGNDLVIRLEWSNDSDPDGDSITIKNMGSHESRIETLTLLDDTGKATAWISLQSVFDQLSSPRERFRVVNETNEFGYLTAPVA